MKIINSIRCHFNLHDFEGIWKTNNHFEYYNKCKNCKSNLLVTVNRCGAVIDYFNLGTGVNEG